MDKKYNVSSDSDGLPWLEEDPEEVNGSEDCEIPEFTPTKHELIQIAKYWYDRVLDYDFFYFTYSQYSGTHWREKMYAYRRIGRVAEILSEEEFNELLAGVERDFKKNGKISDKNWNIFMKGSGWQWAAHADKVQQKIQRRDERATKIRSILSGLTELPRRRLHKCEQR